jgi:hypothetical protein
MSSFLQGQPRVPMFDAAGNFTPAWAGWFSQAQQILQDLSSSGSTASRPTNALYTGKFYFDTTLGLPIWVKSVNPTVWVNGAGAAV